MNKAKIRLSKKEQQMVQDADVILTKNQIMQKARLLLELLQQDFIGYLRSDRIDVPEEIKMSVPKISRGENYLGLPYLILDYPRRFNMESIFAIRTMFWWGNFFSITLHLSGSYKSSYEKNIIGWYPILKKEKYFININDDQWEHHFEKSNYTKVDTISKAAFEKNIRENIFLKIAYKIPLSKWDKTAEKLFRQFKMLSGIAGQLPSR
jgi:hypothetical protein